MLTLKEGRGGEREKRNLETENKFLSKNGGGLTYWMLRGIGAGSKKYRRRTGRISRGGRDPKIGKPIFSGARKKWTAGVTGSGVVLKYRLES